MFISYVYIYEFPGRWEKRQWQLQDGDLRNIKQDEHFIRNALQLNSEYRDRDEIAKRIKFKIKMSNIAGDRRSQSFHENGALLCSNEKYFALVNRKGRIAYRSIPVPFYLRFCVIEFINVTWIHEFSSNILPRIQSIFERIYCMSNECITDSIFVPRIEWRIEKKCQTARLDSGLAGALWPCRLASTSTLIITAHMNSMSDNVTSITTNDKSEHEFKSREKNMSDWNSIEVQHFFFHCCALKNIRCRLWHG